MCSVPSRPLTLLLLLLAPSLVLAQPASPHPADAPLRALEPGARLRVLTAGGQQKGKLLGVDEGELRLWQGEDGEMRVPLAALTLVERERRDRSVKRGLIIGGLVLGVPSALLGAGYCSLGEEFGMNVPECTVILTLSGTIIGAFVGAVVGALKPDWEPVWVRPRVLPQRVFPPMKSRHPPKPVPPPTEATPPPQQPEARPAGPLPEP
jgi:hypothetical protein